MYEKKRVTLIAYCHTFIKRMHGHISGNYYDFFVGGQSSLPSDDGM